MAEARRRVVVYVLGHDCPLCDEALFHLADLGRTVSFDLRVVVVDADPRLALRHALRAPVVEVDGVEALHGKTTRRALENALFRGEVEPPA